MNNPVFEVKQVTARSRVNFLPKHAGMFYMAFENMIFDMASKFSSSYSGGVWDFKEGKAAAGENEQSFFYLVPDGETFEVCNENNYFDGQLTGEAYGVGVTLISLSQYLFVLDRESSNPARSAEQQEAIANKMESLCDSFYALRDYAKTLPEAKTIFRFID